MRRLHRATRVPLLAMCALLAACRFDEQTIGVGRTLPAVHAVLNPARPSQVVLVEQTLSGRVEVGEGRPNPLEPIASQRGIPVSGARVVVYGPAGDSAVAIEDRVLRSDHTGAGVYRFYNSAEPASPAPELAGAYLQITGGSHYTLRVTTPAGDVVTGETTVPAASDLFSVDFRQFNRDRDSLFLTWSPVEATHRYELRIETPRGPLQLFVDSTEYLVAGSLRNVFTEGIPPTFVPGFTQTIVVGAVDRNYYDYYRSRNDPFTGTGLVSHLAGGLGLFGSYAVLRLQSLQVSADSDDPIEGTYRLQGPARPPVPSSFTLWIDSRQGGRVQLSGHHAGNGSGAAPGLIGVLEGGRVTIAMLDGQFVTDTLVVLDGRLEGGTITAHVRGGTQPLEFRK